MGPDTRSFLAAIWGDQTGIAELTTIGSEGIRSHPFNYPESFDSFLTACQNHSGHRNVYFGVCLRNESWKAGKRGTEKMALSSLCVWADVDFKNLPREKALALAKEFPLPPSITVKSGGGAHLYWLLKEPATGDDLMRVKTINKALAKWFGADPQAIDLARILRVPGTLNMKYAPPAPCETSVFKTARAYNLAEFDFLPQPAPAASPADGDQAATGPHENPNFPMSPEALEEAVRAATELWVLGFRHNMALCLSTVLANAGFSEVVAAEIVRRASDASGGETENRLRDVRDTYARYVRGDPVKGGPTAEKVIEDAPEAVRDRLKKHLEQFMRTIKKAAPKRISRANFSIVKVIKFDSRPACYRVVLKPDSGELLNVDVPDTPTLTTFKHFKNLAYEQSGFFPSCKQPRWEEMISRADTDVLSAPEEASIPGAMRTALEEFLEGKVETPDEAVLKSLPGYNDSEVFFRTDAYTAYLSKEHGVKPERQQIFKFLRGDGWESGTVRIGPKIKRAWKRKVPENGSLKQGDQPDMFGKVGH